MSILKAQKNREATEEIWRREWHALLAEVPDRPHVPVGMPALRPSLTTKRGQRVNTNEPIWRIYRTHTGPRQVSVNIDLLYRPYEGAGSQGVGKLAGIPRRVSVFSPDLVHAMVLYIARLAERYTGANSEFAVNEFARFERFLAASDEEAGGMTPSLLTRELFEPFARETPDHKGFIQRFYRWCVVQGFAGYSARECVRIDSVACSRGTPRGAHIRSSDPQKGALIWDEKTVLVRAVQNPAEGTEPWDRATVWLLFELGCRVSALAALLNKHLEPTPLRDAYLLNVPRVKKRAPVKATVPRKISKELGDLITSLQSGGAEDPLIPSSFTQQTNWCPTALKRFIKANDVRTPRVTVRDENSHSRFGLLPLTSYRLRYTMATALAEQGASPEQIAAMLDDSTLAMAMVYTANTSQLVDKLEDTLDRHPAWLRHLNLFLGKLSESSETPKLDCVIGGVPYFDNFEKFRDRIPSIGWCSSRQCKDLPPLGCYRCAWFIADPDPGVHVQQLEQLKDELTSKAGVESDRMAKVLRPDMFAISEVIVLTRGGQTTSQRIQAKIAGEGEGK